MARRMAGAAGWLVHDSRKLLSLASPTFFGGFPLGLLQGLGGAVRDAVREPYLGRVLGVC